MPRYGVSVEKGVSFRGAVQPFANVYYYESAISTANEADLTSLLNQIVAQEKTAHSTHISFLRGRVWDTGGSIASNQMRVDIALSGTGTATPDTGQDRERAVLVRYRAGVDSRGRPVYLRKWWHFCATTLGGVAISPSQLAQTAELTTTQRNGCVTFADFFKTINVLSSPNTLVAKTGRTISGATECHRWLEHHQLGDEWRGI